MKTAWRELQLANVHQSDHLQKRTCGCICHKLHKLLQARATCYKTSSVHQRIEDKISPEASKSAQRFNAHWPD